MAKIFSVVPAAIGSAILIAPLEVSPALSGCLSFEYQGER